MSVDASPAVGGAPLRSNGRGAFVALLAFFVFSSGDVFVKLLTGHMPAPQVTFLIAAIGILLMVAYTAATGRMRRLWPRHPGSAFLRAALIAGDTILIHYAFSVPPLAEAYLLSFLTPVLVAILGFLLLGERLSRIGWMGVLLGFAGVAVALKPGVQPLNAGHAAAVGSAVLFALSLVLLSRTKLAENDEALVFSVMLVQAPMALALAATFETLAPVSPVNLALVVGGGLTMMIGHGLLVRAFRIGEASVVAPFQYSQIIWGCLYGLLLFATPVELHTLAGAAIIIISGWLVLK